MIRKLVLPALAAALLAGCVTDYAYRGGDRGDYYYGQPSVEYRYDRYDGYGGYSPYGYGGLGYYGTYGYPYRYYGAPYGYYNRPYLPPYYRPYHRRPPLHYPRPGGHPPQHRRDDRPPPWRNFDGLRRPSSTDGGPASMPQRQAVPDRPAPPESRERGSRMEQTIRRANRAADPRTIEPLLP